MQNMGKRKKSVEPLTEEQQAFAEEHANLIYGFLRKHNLPIDEFYGICAVAFVESVKRFDSSRGTAFSTYCYSAMSMKMQAEYTRKKRKGCLDVTVLSLNTPVYGTNTLLQFQDMVPDSTDYISYIDCSESVRTAISKMGHDEKLVLNLHLKGRDQRSIGKKVGVSQTQVSRIIKRAKKKILEQLNNEKSAPVTAITNAEKP